MYKEYLKTQEALNEINSMDFYEMEVFELLGDKAKAHAIQYRVSIKKMDPDYSLIIKAFGSDVKLDSSIRAGMSFLIAKLIAENIDMREDIRKLTNLIGEKL